MRAMTSERFVSRWLAHAVLRTPATTTSSKSASANDLLDGNLDGRNRAIGPQGHEPIAILVKNRPQGGLVGLGDGQAFDRLARPEAELALLDVRRNQVDRRLAAEQEHQPV